MEKKSFVLTGYVERSHCNCGSISHNCFWQDGGFSGSNHLASLHQEIEKHLDKLSDAGPGKRGNACDVKVTITIEPLGEHDHRILNRHCFSGLGMVDNQELKNKITEPSFSENEIQLKGKEEFKKTKKELHKNISIDYLQDICDKLLLVKRTGDVTKLEDLQNSIQKLIED